MLERFENVGISLRIATENFPEKWHDQAQIAEVNCAPYRIVRLTELQHQQPPAGFAHAMHLRKTGPPVAQISQTITNRNNVERILWIRQILRVAEDEVGMI